MAPILFIHDATPNMIEINGRYSQIAHGASTGVSYLEPILQLKYRIQIEQLWLVYLCVRREYIIKTEYWITLQR